MSNTLVNSGAGRLSPLAAIVAICLLATASACSSDGQVGDAPSAATVTASRPVEHSSLCAAIRDDSVAVSVTGSDGALVTSAPLYPAGKQIAGCEYTNPASPNSVVDITLEPNIQDGVSKFERLQDDTSLTRINVNGTKMVGSQSVLYALFVNVNSSLAGTSRGVECVIAITFRDHAEVVEVRPLTPESYAARLAAHLIDDINDNKVNASSSTKISSPTPDPGPILVDLQGRPVPNPAIVVAIYNSLLEGATMTLTYKYGVGASVSDNEWSNRALSVESTSVRADVIDVLRTHPFCNPDCTYPGFVIAGTKNSEALADAAKLGMDPSKMGNGTNIPVLRTVFLNRIGWNGVYPPGH